MNTQDMAEELAHRERNERERRGLPSVAQSKHRTGQMQADWAYPERCACGHFQLPTHRDACVALSPGVSDQHGRLHCERIELGTMPKPVISQRPVMRGYGRQRREVMEDRAWQPPREVRLSRLDR